MKRIYILFSLLFLFYFVCAEEHSHIDEYEVRYVKESKELNLVLQEQLRNQNAWQLFLKDNPNWFVYFNENNLKPHRAFGEPIDLDIGSSIAEKIDNFITRELNMFLIPEDIRLTSFNTNDKYKHYNFGQYYKELEVLDSRLYIKLYKNNRLIAFGLDVFSDIDIDINPIISNVEASEIAAQNITNPIKNIYTEEKLKILPIPKNQKYEYHLIYVVHLETTIEQGPANYICYVDARNGELLMRNNKVKYESLTSNSVHVEGGVYTTNPFNTSSVENLKNLKVNYNNTNYYTDNLGNVVLPSSSGTATYSLEGLYAMVQTNGQIPSFSSLASNSTVLLNNTNSTIQERTAFWAVNEIHDHAKQVISTNFNGSSPFTAVDIPLETNVDDNSNSCNAYFGGGSINFYAEGGGCNATAKIPDVVYHEYGHFINSLRYGASGMWNGGLNEGYADLWALTLTQTPVLGFGWDISDPTVYVRRYDQARKVYPQDLSGEVHADGEIIAGAFWDTYLNLNDMQQMIDLFKYTFDAAPDGPNGTEGIIYTDILLEVLYADDNDGNLTNGTPNDIDIISAFALHGITLISNAIVAHNAVISSLGNIPINLSATVQLTYPWALANVSCNYRLNNSTTWNTVSMNQMGINYIASIPAQLNGTIIAYYIYLEDNWGFESGIIPMASNILPIKDANVPNFILVGYELREQEDFDFSSNIGVWSVNPDNNDNATTGIWQFALPGNTLAPLGSFSDPLDPSTIVQTDDDHTVGGTNCAFTANATSIFSGIGEEDVDDGRTTLELIFAFSNIANYNNPAITYWRWYTNSPPSGANPGADWWKVKISGDGGFTWNYIENNISSDISWRRFSFRVHDYINLASITSSQDIMLRFIASDSLGGSLIEAAIDDIYVYEAQANSTFTNNLYLNQNLELLYVTDLLGRIVDPEEILNPTVLLYIYRNGLVRKKIFSPENTF